MSKQTINKGKEADFDAEGRKQEVIKGQRSMKADDDEPIVEGRKWKKVDEGVFSEAKTKREEHNASLSLVRDPK